MIRIIIIGYMGAGKTTVGHGLSKALNLPFYDLDWYIQTRMRKTVAQIFEEQGEEGFRKIERNMLHEVAEFEDVIISCGGGTPCFYDNIDYLNAQGITVFLNARTDVICQHLKMGKSVRPLLLNKTEEEVAVFVEQQLQQRMPYYQKAQHHIEVNLMHDKKVVDETVHKILQLVKQPAQPNTQS